MKKKCTIVLAALLMGAMLTSCGEPAEPVGGSSFLDGEPITIIEPTLTPPPETKESETKESETTLPLLPRIIPQMASSIIT